MELAAQLFGDADTPSLTDLPPYDYHIPTANEEALQQPSVDPIFTLAGLGGVGLSQGAAQSLGMLRPILWGQLLGAFLQPNHPTATNVGAMPMAGPKGMRYLYKLADYAAKQAADIPNIPE